MICRRFTAEESFIAQVLWLTPTAQRRPRFAIAPQGGGVGTRGKAQGTRVPTAQMYPSVVLKPKARQRQSDLRLRWNFARPEDTSSFRVFRVLRGSTNTRIHLCRSLFIRGSKTQGPVAPRFTAQVELRPPRKYIFISCLSCFSWTNQTQDRLANEIATGR
jgi:hypothetical protein